MCCLYFAPDYSANRTFVWNLTQMSAAQSTSHRVGNSSREESSNATVQYGEYTLIKELGKGSFGVVHKCIRQDTKEVVAVKIIQKEYAWMGKREVKILNSLKKCCHGTKNMVKLNRHRMHNGEVLLEFEMLDLTISQFMTRYYRSLHLSEIQSIAQQMLEALDTLKSISVAHSDLKPDNIMFIDHKLQPMKVKLIDFGLATHVSGLPHGNKIQAHNYRAPEVTLGLHLNEAVDMWSLGCILAFIYLRSHLFSRGACDHQITQEIIQMLGPLENQMLENGICTANVFYKDGNCWKLSDPCTCKERKHHTRKRFSSLDDITLTRPNTAECEDTQAFVSLLKEMLILDPDKRVTPSQALKHPFLTTKHFPSDPSLSLNDPSPSFTAEKRSSLKLSKFAEIDKGSSTRYDGVDRSKQAAAYSDRRTGTNSPVVKEKNKRRFLQRIRGFLSRTFGKLRKPKEYDYNRELGKSQSVGRW